MKCNEFRPEVCGIISNNAQRARSNTIFEVLSYGMQCIGTMPTKMVSFFANTHLSHSVLPTRQKNNFQNTHKIDIKHGSKTCQPPDPTLICCPGFQQSPGWHQGLRQGLFCLPPRWNQSINQSITSKVSSSLKALGNRVAFLRRWRKVSSPAPQLALTSSGRTSLATQLCLFKKPKSVISGIQHLQMRTRTRQLNSFTGSQMAKARSFRFVWWLCWCDCFYFNCVDMIVVIVIVLMLLLLFWLSCCDCCYCDCVVVIVVIVIVLLWLLLMWLLLLLMLFSSAGKWNQPCSPSSPCPAGAGDCDGSDCRTGLFSPKQIVYLEKYKIIPSQAGLVCGVDNCARHLYPNPTDDCCKAP